MTSYYYFRINFTDDCSFLVASSIVDRKVIASIRTHSQYTTYCGHNIVVLSSNIFSIIEYIIWYQLKINLYENL